MFCAFCSWLIVNAFLLVVVAGWVWVSRLLVVRALTAILFVILNASRCDVTVLVGFCLILGVAAVVVVNAASSLRNTNIVVCSFVILSRNPDIFCSSESIDCF